MPRFQPGNSLPAVTLYPRNRRLEGSGVTPSTRNWRLRQFEDHNLSDRTGAIPRRTWRHFDQLQSNNRNFEPQNPGAKRLEDRDLSNLSNAENAGHGARDGGNNNTAIANNWRRRNGNPVVPFDNANRVSFSDAWRRCHEFGRDRHDRDWWNHRCNTIILIGGGFWAWDAGWWYPAWGYDPYYSDYAYNGPIYGYDGLPPDQVIANVQSALQELGYFPYAVDGVLGPSTQQAIANYQGDHGLYATGAIDRPTLASLGFVY